MNIAEAFREIIDLSTMLGVNQFRIRAYSNALKVIEGMGGISSVSDVKKKKGFGESICTAIEQIFATGTCDKLEDLRATAPPKSVMELTGIPGVGPKTALGLWRKYGCTGLGDLEMLISRGEPGVQQYKKGVQFAQSSRERTPIGFVLPAVTPILERLKRSEWVYMAHFAGSLRRKQETIRDVDFLVIPEQYNETVLAQLRTEIFEILRDELGECEVEAEGERKVRARDQNGLQIDFLFVPDYEQGAALQYFTGSKEHNVELRKRAIDKGLKLNEKGLFNGDGKVVAGSSEHDIYAHLGVPTLPPELRQDGTEVGKSAPQNLITLPDLTGTLHNHTVWSDGRADVADMVQAAYQRGHKYIAITDHTKAVAIANGLNEERWLAQKEEVDRFKASVGLSSFIKVYHSAEMDVLQDGTCDYPLELIEQMDFVLLALHRQPQRDPIKRFVKAMGYLRDNLKGDKTIILAHPTGRQFGKSGIPDINWGELFNQCAIHNVVLEINSTPSRLDLPDALCGLAKKNFGLKFSISSDSHAPEHLNFLELGINVARRAWLERDDVINTREDPFA